MATEKNYYEILGVSKTATTDEVRHAYRNLMKENHPDISKSEDEEFAKTLNEAYEVLSDEEKRRIYDESLEDEIECDNPEEFFTEDEIRYNRIVNLKILIEQELSKSIELIEYKNEVLSLGLGELNGKEYFDNVRSIVHTFSLYIKSLETLRDSALEYELFEELETLQDTIDFLEGEMKDIPLSPSELKLKIERERQKATIISKVDEEISNGETLQESFKDILSMCYERQMDYLEYSNYRRSFIFNAKTCIGKLKGYAEVLKRIGEKEKYNAIIKLSADLNNRINALPKNYEEARSLGYAEILKRKMREALDIWQERWDKIDRLEALFEKYPASQFVDKLLEYCLKCYDEAYDSFQSLDEECEQIWDKLSYTSKRELAKKYSDEAQSIFAEADKVHKNASNVARKISKFKNPDIDENHVLILSQSALAGYNKGLALKLLVKAESIIETLKQGDLLDDEFKTLYEEIKYILENLSSDKESLKERTYTLQTEVNPYSKFSEKDFVSKLRKIKLKMVANAIFSTFFLGGGAKLFKTAAIYPPDMNILFLTTLLLVSFSSIFAGGREIWELFPNYREHREVKKFYNRYKSLKH